MAHTLFQATLDLARILMDVYESTATGGSTSTVVDSSIFQPSNHFSDDPKGTLWLKLATVASKVITGHTTTTLTFSPAQAGAVVAGDRYAAAPGHYPKYALIQAINAALAEMGKLPYQAQITPTAEKETYTVSDNAVFAEEIIGVQIGNASTSPYAWMPHYRWRQEYTGTGPAMALIFDEGSEPQNTYPMLIYYRTIHPEVKLDSDVIHPSVHPDRLKWEAAVHALRWKYQRTKQDDPAQVALLNEAQDKAVTMRLAFPIIRQEATPRHARW